MEESRGFWQAILWRFLLYVDPTKFELLLVGPRVAQLKPFFDARGYRVDPVVAGRDALRTLADRPRDLVIVELNLGDMRASEFVTNAREDLPELRVILLENADRAGQIVKALVHGIDAYVPTPPDENKLFAEVERQLLSVTARNQMSEQGVDLQTSLSEARSEISQLRMQNQLIRQELDATHQELQDATAGAADAQVNAEEVAALMQQIEVLQDRAGHADIVELELRNLGIDDDNLLDGIHWVQEQLSQLGEANVAAAMAKATADDLTSELISAKDELARVRTEAEALTARNAELAALADDASRVETLVADLERTTNALAEANAARSAAQEEHTSETDRAAAEIARLQSDLERADADVEVRAEQLRTLTASKDSLEQELTALAESLQAKHAALDEKTAEVVKLSEQVQSLQRDLETADARALEAAQPQIAAQLEAVEVEREALVRKQEEAEKLREEAEDRLLVVDVEFDELRAKISELEEKLAASEAEVRDERRKRVEERELGSSTEYAQQVEDLLVELREVKRERDALLNGS